jgi:D-xylose transport system permease protein
MKAAPEGPASSRLDGSEQRNGSRVPEPTAPASAEVIITDTASWVAAWWRRVRSGESGMLPVLAGLIVIVVLFQLENSLFLSAGNLVNLLVQGATFVLLGMAEVFVLLLGEIDLSVGYVAGVAASVMAILASPIIGKQPWWVALGAGLAVATVIGVVQGVLITKLNLPSFVVTLAGLLGWEGVMLYLIDHAAPAAGGVIAISSNVLNDIVNGNLSPVAGWILAAVVVGVWGLWLYLGAERLRRAGLAAPPRGIVLLRIGIGVVAAVALLLVANTNRGVTVTLEGVPFVIPLLVAVLAMYTFVLNRTRFGRYVYAIGGNAEAARRAGINLARVRVAAFALSGLTAGIAGVVYASRLGSISENIDGGTLVLYGVAAAVIGGTSLFGGRGKMVHAVLGGVIIAAIYNGLGLLGVSAAAEYIVTALVLLAAVTVDSLTRRRQGAEARR